MIQTKVKVFQWFYGAMPARGPSTSVVTPKVELSN
jgi:hypothetical protein